MLFTKDKFLYEYLCITRQEIMAVPLHNKHLTDLTHTSVFNDKSRIFFTI